MVRRCTVLEEYLFEGILVDSSKSVEPLSSKPLHQGLVIWVHVTRSGVYLFQEGEKENIPEGCVSSTCGVVWDVYLAGDTYAKRRLHILEVSSPFVKLTVYLTRVRSACEVFQPHATTTGRWGTPYILPAMKAVKQAQLVAAYNSCISCGAHHTMVKKVSKCPTCRGRAQMKATP